MSECKYKTTCEYCSDNITCNEDGIASGSCGLYKTRRSEEIKKEKPKSLIARIFDKL